MAIEDQYARELSRRIELEKVIEGIIERTESTLAGLRAVLTKTRNGVVHPVAPMTPERSAELTANANAAQTAACEAAGVPVPGPGPTPPPAPVAAPRPGPGRPRKVKPAAEGQVSMAPAPEPAVEKEKKPPVVDDERRRTVETPRWCACGKPLTWTTSRTWECVEHGLHGMPMTVKEGQPGENLSQLLTDAAQKGLALSLVDVATWPVLRRDVLRAWLAQGGDVPEFLTPVAEAPYAF